MTAFNAESMAFPRSSTIALSLLTVLLASALGLPRPARAALPRPAHVVVIVEENKSLEQIDGSDRATFINAIAKRGAFFVHAHGVTHPSLPNYLALFAGVTNTNGDGCPAAGISPSAPNLGSELLAAHLSFTGYAEALPGEGSTVCAAGTYARKHAPWVAFENVPKSSNRPFADLPRSYDALPTVSFLIPDVDDDMHDGSIADGDSWLEKHVKPLLAWADAHDTLVIVTWDEGYDPENTIPTIFYGPMVKPGRYAERVDHYATLRTLEDMYGLALTGKASSAPPIADCWK
jgi:acid phosphatase